MMAYIKRFHNYETIGGLFRDTYQGLREITVIDCIWEAILEVVCIVAEILECNEEAILKRLLIID